MSRTVLFWLTLLSFVSGSTLLALAMKNHFGSPAGGTTEEESARDTDPLLRLPGADQPWLKSYELTERSERKIGTANLAGKIHVVSFFFASCPASCKTQNHHLAGLVREFEKDGVKFLAITCDPDTDSPAKLREYATTNFNAPRDSWYFLTGDLLYTRRIAAEVYGVALDRKTHVEKFILVDQQGEIRGRFAWADDVEFQKLKREIRELLKIGAKPPALEGEHTSDLAPTEQTNSAANNTAEKTAE